MNEEIGQAQVRAAAERIVSTLAGAGHIAYFAGGCVRDELLGLKPKDYDVATDAPPQKVRSLFPRTQAVGAAFGVILVRQDEAVVEVATFRSDGEYRDGRHPESVRFATPQEDAQRRDFTINGLFFDPNRREVLDYVGGQDDLRARRLRAIGDPQKRFGEDHLRLLRAVRFAARFGLEIEPRTADAVRFSASRLIGISPERIAEELRLMLSPPTRAEAAGLLNEFGLFDVIFRFITDPILRPVDPTSALNLGDAPVPLPLVLAGELISRLGGLSVFESLTVCAGCQCGLRKALRWSNDEGDAFLQFLHNTAVLLSANEARLALRRRLLATSSSPLTLRLIRALSAFTPAAALRLDGLTSLAADPIPPPLITGDDLSDLGLRPGPMFKRILDQVYDEQLEGRITDQSQALRFVEDWVTREK